MEIYLHDRTSISHASVISIAITVLHRGALVSFPFHNKIASSLKLTVLKLKLF